MKTLVLLLKPGYLFISHNPFATVSLPCSQFHYPHFRMAHQRKLLESLYNIKEYEAYPILSKPIPLK